MGIFRRIFEAGSPETNIDLQNQNGISVFIAIHSKAMLLNPRHMNIFKTMFFKP
jgi:hypothetical protein